ncbi:MAG: YraN family protein [Candidatus Omnitrophota bacterium]|nr:YraN family protein [Candidatus Omnitrophota bacterium]
MSKQTRDLGWRGEKIALTFLKKRRYHILQTNFSCPLGEIDLIAKQSNDIVFIEVKTRKSFNYGMPLDSITQKKKRQLVKTALFYLKKYKLIQEPCRFDVISVSIINQQTKPRIELIKDAFWCEEAYKSCWQGQNPVQL